MEFITGRATANEFSSNLQSQTDEFLKLCATTFGWGDLSQDTVMDLGCGRELHCSRTILRNFPNVKSIIALDGSPEEMKMITFQSDQIRPVFANILMWRDIRDYQGKIDKVISTRALHQNPEKEAMFKNVYRLLKPGGEAAFLFTSDVGIYHVLRDLKEDPKYKNFFKGLQIYGLYSRQLEEKHYKEMLEATKFKIVKISTKKDIFPMDTFKLFEETLHHQVGRVFAVPSNLVPEINKAASRLYKKLHCGNETFYTKTEMTILVTKPSDSGSGSSSD